MGNAADWIEDQHHRLYYGGTMPEAYRDDEEAAAASDEGPALGYEAAQPALQASSSWLETA